MPKDDVPEDVLALAEQTASEWNDGGPAPRGYVSAIADVALHLRREGQFDD